MQCLQPDASHLRQTLRDKPYILRLRPPRAVLLEGLRIGVGLQDDAVQRGATRDVLEFLRAEQGLGEGDFESEVEDFSGVVVVALEVVGGASEFTGILVSEDG